MAAIVDTQRPSALPSTLDANDGDEKQAIWTTLLDAAASTKALPLKNLIILGGDREQQNQVIDSLAQKPSARARQADIAKTRPPAATNELAIGYTYQNVYDADHEDLVARVSIYTLSECSPSHFPLLARLFSPAVIEHTAVVILLDLAEPWAFARSLCAWIRLVREALQDTTGAVDIARQVNFQRWKTMRNNDMATSILDDTTTMLPLSLGEYTDPLGVPLLVNCYNALAMDRLERERGFKESHFDYIVQYLRTVLMTHGAGLLYTMPEQESQLRPLVHRMLDIDRSMDMRLSASRRPDDKQIKYNVVDREGVLVPPGWDTWAKIKVLKDSFDAEGISKAWKDETQMPDNVTNVKELFASTDEEDGVITRYETQIMDPRPPRSNEPKLEYELVDDQVFLRSQLVRLEAFEAEDEAKLVKQRESAKKLPVQSSTDASTTISRPSIQDHIGPVQFNVGGIQYDAEEAVRELKERKHRATQASAQKAANAETVQRMLADAGQSTPDRLNSIASLPKNDTQPYTPVNQTRTESESQSQSSPRPSSRSRGPGMKEGQLENLEAYFSSLVKGAGRVGSPRVASPRGPAVAGSAAGSAAGATPAATEATRNRTRTSRMSDVISGSTDVIDQDTPKKES